MHQLIVITLQVRLDIIIKKGAAEREVTFRRLEWPQEKNIYIIDVSTVTSGLEGDIPQTRDFSDCTYTNLPMLLFDIYTIYVFPWIGKINSMGKVELLVRLGEGKYNWSQQVVGRQCSVSDRLLITDTGVSITIQELYCSFI